MAMPEEIRRGDLERDRLLHLNRSLPGRPSVTVIHAASGLVGLVGKVRAIANRGHQEHGCIGPEDWCPFCELLSITKM